MRTAEEAGKKKKNRTEAKKPKKSYNTQVSDFFKTFVPGLI